MKSKINIKGHPLHPILVPFPIAFFIGTLVFDILSRTNNNPNFWQTAGYLEIAGVVTGVVAALPGFVDYLYVVPPDSSAKLRATQHALVNLVMLVIFAAAWFIRSDNNTTVIIALETVGVVLLGISGWLGGTLVYRNQIGVDPRYAGAGKWSEAYFDDGAGPIAVASEDELKTDQMKLLHIEGKRIVLAKTENGYLAFDDRCSHKGGSLAAGTMICGTVQCPWHGSQFDCKTGAVKAGPATEGINVYDVKVSDGQIYLSV